MSYRYSVDTCQEISHFISKELPLVVDDTIAKFKRRGKQDITINTDISSAIIIETEEVINRLRTYHVKSKAKGSKHEIFLDVQGFRLQKMLRLLIKSIAYDRGRNEANYEDLVTLKELANLIRLPDNPKEI